MRACVSAFLLVLSATAARAQDNADQCRDILVYAAHNINQSFSTSSMASDVKSAMCNTTSNASSTSAGGSGGLLVFGVFGLKAGGARQQIQNMKTEVCSNGENALSNQQLDTALSNMVDHDSVDAWKQCMANNGSGLIGSVERSDDLVLLRLRWVARFDVDSATIQSVTASGVTCSSLWPAGKVIKSVPQILQCDGTPTKAVSVVIQTDRDAIILKSPVVKVDLPKAEPKPEIEQCYDGDVAICEKLIGDNDIKCSRMGGPPAQLRMCQQASISLRDVSNAYKEKDRTCQASQSAPACGEAKDRVGALVSMLKSPPAFFPPPVPGMPPRPLMPR